MSRQFLCKVAMWRQARPEMGWGGGRGGLICTHHPLALSSGISQPQGTFCPLNALGHRTIETQSPKPPQKSEGKRPQSFHLSESYYHMLSCFKGPVAK